MNSSTVVRFHTDGPSPTEGRLSAIGTSLRAGLFVLMSTAVPVVDEIRSPTSPPVIALERAASERRRRYRAPIEHGMDRLKRFGKYKDDWDSRGAAAPMAKAIDAALRYLTFLQPWHPNPLATINREGEAILEFDDNEAFSSIRFRDENGLIVELYRRPKDGHQSIYKEGLVQNSEINAFILEKLKLPILPHDFV